jgi:hypothetical protein
LKKRVYINQIYNRFRDFLKIKSISNNIDKENLKVLQNDGVIVFKKKFNLDLIDYKKYIDQNNFDFVSKTLPLSSADLHKLCNNLDKEIINLIKNYLGQDLYCYEGMIKTLGNLKSTEESWQPHHDGRSRKLRIFIWLDKINYNTHPLYYLKKSHKAFKIWKTYEHTRRRDLNKKLDKIYGDLGDILIFDTHGYHSDFKDTTEPRSVINLTIEAYGSFIRVNRNNFNSEVIRLDMKNLNQILGK